MLLDSKTGAFRSDTRLICKVVQSFEFFFSGGAHSLMEEGHCLRKQRGVAASYSDTNRRVSAQPGIKTGANVAIETNITIPRLR